MTDKPGDHPPPPSGTVDADAAHLHSEDGRRILSTPSERT
jgi:hypothetical protein